MAKFYDVLMRRRKYRQEKRPVVDETNVKDCKCNCGAQNMWPQSPDTLTNSYTLCTPCAASLRKQLH